MRVTKFSPFFLVRHFFCPIGDRPITNTNNIARTHSYHINICHESKAWQFDHSFNFTQHTHNIKTTARLEILNSNPPSCNHITQQHNTTERSHSQISIGSLKKEWSKVVKDTSKLTYIRSCSSNDTVMYVCDITHNNWSCCCCVSLTQHFNHQNTNSTLSFFYSFIHSNIHTTSQTPHSYHITSHHTHTTHNTQNNHTYILY